MKFIRENNITVTDFADKVVKIPRASVSLYFNSTSLSWSKANPMLRSGLINVCFWMDLDPEARLEAFRGGCHKSNLHHTMQVQDQESGLLEQARLIVNAQYVTDPGPNERDIDTETIAGQMKVELRKAAISLKSFAQVVKVNRNYFASMINNPMNWTTCTKLQKSVYRAMKAWVDHRTNPQSHVINTALSSRMALKPLNGQEILPNKGLKCKQKRVKFTAEQRHHLMEFFKTNQRPNQEEKLALSKRLGLSVRTVMIFFCNRRTRLNLLERQNSSE